MHSYSLVQTLTQACWDGSGKKCVEIGTLTGLSALYWLQMLGGNGTLWSFEKSPEHFAHAEKNLKSYIEKKHCHLVLGDALEKLPAIEDQGPFDFIFILKKYLFFFPISYLKISVFCKV